MGQQPELRERSYRDVAQAARARGSYPRGRRFESTHLHWLPSWSCQAGELAPAIALVAQLVERRAEASEVARSMRAEGTMPSDARALMMAWFQTLDGLATAGPTRLESGRSSKEGLGVRIPRHPLRSVSLIRLWYDSYGWVSERSKETVLKTVMAATPSRVRIPPHPLHAPMAQLVRAAVF